MKKNSITYLMVAFSCLIFSIVQACPFTMINNGKRTMLVIDVQNDHVVRIEPGKSAKIDPSLHGWRKYLRPEKLDIYLERPGHKNVFDRYYRFIEKYCLTNGSGNTISLTDIQKLAQKPTDRMRVDIFKSE